MVAKPKAIRKRNSRKYTECQIKGFFFFFLELRIVATFFAGIAYQAPPILCWFTKPLCFNRLRLGLSTLDLWDLGCGVARLFGLDLVGLTVEVDKQEQVTCQQCTTKSGSAFSSSTISETARQIRSISKGEVAVRAGVDDNQINQELADLHGLRA